MSGLLVLTCLGPNPAIALEGELGEPFVLDSTGSTYPFVMRLEGKTTRKGDDIEVEVTTGLVRSAIPSGYGDEGAVTHVTIAFGLGSDSERGWQFTNETLVQAVSADLKPDESLPVTAHQFVIKGVGALPLADMWLAADLTVDQKLPELAHPGPLHSQACSSVNLLGETTRSKDRKKRMIENYAKAC